VGVYGLIRVWLPRVIGAGVSVNGSALVFCRRDMWLLGGRNVCAIYFLCTCSFGVLVHWSRYYLVYCCNLGSVLGSDYHAGVFKQRLF
jgi:hypothetical protein